MPNRINATATQRYVRRPYRWQSATVCVVKARNDPLPPRQASA